MPTVYLLHFDRPYWRYCRHYVGYTVMEVEERLDRHNKGTGSKLVKYALEQGCRYELARWWSCETIGEARALESKLKRSKNLPKYCLICRDLKRKRRDGVIKTIVIAEDDEKLAEALLEYFQLKIELNMPKALEVVVAHEPEQVRAALNDETKFVILDGSVAQNSGISLEGVTPDRVVVFSGHDAFLSQAAILGIHRFPKGLTRLGDIVKFVLLAVEFRLKTVG